MADQRPILTEDRPLRVVVVGAGPSGFYAVEALFKAPGVNVTCDMIDRLPTPFGLVRGGVAPDHQSIKRVVKVYEKVAADPRFTFFGNVRLGQDVSVEDLRATYDAIIYAVGNESDRRMGIPGEDLPGVHSATDFVGWYNGHPDYTEHRFDLSARAVAVIGVGNVAIDVARILARDPAELAGTDIAAHSMGPLESSAVEVIYLIGRRGCAQAAFSPKEIRELGSLDGADLVVSDADATPDALSAAWLVDGADRDAQKNVAYLQEKAAEAPAGKPRRIEVRFLLSPVAFIPGEDGRLAKVRLERNELVAGRGGPRPQGTGAFEELEVGLAFKAVGYRGIPIPGVPFHERWGVVCNVDGRVTPDEASQEPIPGEYVVGWAKRGPSGLIGTNKPDSIATVKNLLDDYTRPEGPPRRSYAEAGAFAALLAERGHPFVTFADWGAIDAAETERGRAGGKLREKFTRIDEMLKLRG